MIFDDFLDAAVKDTPEDLAVLVQKLTSASIDKPDERAALIGHFMTAAMSLTKRYSRDIKEVEKHRALCEPKDVTALIFKATYLFETVYTLSDDSSPLRDVARHSASMTYDTAADIKQNMPNWAHDFPLSQRIARLSNI